MKTLKYVAALFAFFLAGRLFGIVGCLVLLGIFYWAGYFDEAKDDTPQQTEPADQVAKFQRLPADDTEGGAA